MAPSEEGKSCMSAQAKITKWFTNETRFVYFFNLVSGSNKPAGVSYIKVGEDRSCSNLHFYLHNF